MKTCSTCGVEKPLTEFYKGDRYRDGYRGQCKPCTCAKSVEYQQSDVGREKKRAWVENNPRTRPYEQLTRQRLWTWHRLRIEQYDEMLAAQGGVCAICKSDEPGGQGRFHVDHDHSCCPTSRSCGKCARGLLCSRCNPMIGMAKDDPKILAAAVDYLVFGGMNA